MINGDIEIGVLVGFIAALNGFFDPIGQLSQVYTTYQSGMAALDKIFELLDVQPELDRRPDAHQLARIRGEIRFEDVSFRYRTGTTSTKYALEDVVDDRAPGPDGRARRRDRRGQVDLRQARRALLRPDRRAACSSTATTCATCARESLRSQMGIVPQEAFLFSGTIGDNIAFGRPERRRGEIEAAARAVGAWDFIAALPDGLDTEVGERGAQLSAGQRQLLAFARALIADPRILVLDEATSNVDLHTEGRIEAGLRRLLAGRTAIVIAHRLSTIRQAGRIVVLDQGRIVEQGTHDELIEAGGAVRARCTATGPSRRRRDAVRAPRRRAGRRRADGRGHGRGLRDLSRVRPGGLDAAVDLRRDRAACCACSARTTSGTASPSTRASWSATWASCPPITPSRPAGDPRLAHFRQLFVARAHWGSGLATRLHGAAIAEAARPRLHGHAPVHAGGAGARAALLRARGLGARPRSASSRIASASRSRSTAARSERLLDQPAPHRLGDRGRAVGDAELLVERLEVRLDGRRAQVQLRGDRRRAQALGDQAAGRRCSRGVRAGRPGSARRRIAAARPAWTSSGRITSPRATAAIASQMRSPGAAFDR